MSQTIEQAEELRAKAISLLLAERQQINDALATLSYGVAQPQPKKSQRRKQTPAGSETDAVPLEI